MIRNRFILKAFAIFLIVETIGNTVAPTMLMALTAGPTAPEATSFEPVDTTDMVNLANGKLSYNIPLLEVPGPSGGYPLSLSYHAGIQPNEESSWIGLGWNINPGSILRNVNGFADDHYDADNFSRYFWKGGSTSTYSAGVTVGIAGTPLSVSAGLSYSMDTYQGVGVGGRLGVGSMLGNSPIGVHASIGISPYGTGYASAGVSFTTGVGAAGVNTSVGISTNFQSVSGYGAAGVSVGYKGGSVSAFDASISTSSKGVSGGVIGGGLTFVSNSNAGRISSYSNGFEIPIPVWYGISITLGYNYERYWIDQLDRVKVNGVLNHPNSVTPFNSTFFDDRAFDSYSLVDPKSSAEKNAEEYLGGVFPNADNYVVQTQGLFGEMRPYTFQKHLYGHNSFTTDNDNNKDYRVIHYDLERTNKQNMRPEFRFVGDFSNRFEYTPSDIDINSSPPQYDFASGSGLKIGETGSSQYSSNQVQGSQNIQWFTNGEITSHASRVSSAGFIETRSTGFDRSQLKASALGGFTIVNESGVKYNFSLPAYAYAEYSYSEKVSGTTTFNEFSKPEPYAYTWYLTSVVGPDYVDRGSDGNPDGILNEYDWGYWVEFEYGKWTDQYAWRNPSEGLSPDIDNEFRNFSEGKKELYYLDAVRTKTHTAFFVKDIKNDGKSSVYSYRNISNNSTNILRKNESLTTVTKDGYFVPQQITNNCDRSAVFKHDQGTITYISRPVSSLKLNQIILVKNADLSSSTLNKSLGSEYAQTFAYNWSVTHDDNVPGDNCDFSPINFNSHLYQNVIDKYDLAYNDIRSRALRVIEFDNSATSDDLCPETPNSFDYKLAQLSNPYTSTILYPKGGKLTLHSLTFKGTGGTQLIPPMYFNYDLDNPDTGTGRMVSASVGIIETSNVHPGDIIKFKSNNQYCYAVVVQPHTGSTEWDISIIGANKGAIGPINWVQTKNPPYSKDAYDLWGNYKSDYDPARKVINESYERQTTAASSRSVDVWCLRSIRSSLGNTISINYESDSYESVLKDEENLPWIKNITPSTNQTGYLDVYFESGFDAQKVFTVGDVVNLYVMVSQTMLNVNGDPRHAMFVYGPPRLVPQGFSFSQTYSKSNITSVIDPIHIKVFNNELYTQLTQSTYVGYQRDFIAGNIEIDNDLTFFGGGIRVREILVSGWDGRVSSTKYQYQNGKSSFAPLTANYATFNIPNNSYYTNDGAIQDEKMAYRYFLNNSILGLLAISKEIPPPGVLYGSVQVSETVSSGGVQNDFPSYSVYRFQTFEEGMFVAEYDEDNSLSFAPRSYDSFINYDNIKTRKVTFKDYTSRVGALISATVYATVDNQKLSETTYQYLHDDAKQKLINSGAGSITDNDVNVQYQNDLNSLFNNQGVIEETFANGRFVIQQNNKFMLKGVLTKRERYPLIQTSQTTINYKTGIKNTQKALGFDYYSGRQTRTQSSDSYGHNFLESITPAYRYYGAMGLASNGGKNMLTQEADHTVYKMHPSLNGKVVGVQSATAQTWSDQVPALRPDEYQSQAFGQPGVWRKTASFSYIGDPTVTLPSDGLYPVSQFTPFSAWGRYDPMTNGWQKDSEITLYDVNSHALEAIDINGNFSATRMSFDQSMVTVTATNAEYREIGYSGAEDRPVNNFFGNGVYIGEGTYNLAKAHTGKTSLLCQAGKAGFTFYMVPKVSTYHISFWSDKEDVKVRYTFDFNNPTENATVKKIGSANGWNLMEADIKVNDQWDRIKIWCEAGSTSACFDDFRVSPFESLVTSYVYNDAGLVSHILDNNNLYTEYRYDAVGRLVSTFKETLNRKYGSGVTKVSDISYNMGGDKLLIRAFVTGTTGTISGTGDNMIAYGTDYNFVISSNCTTRSTLLSVDVDGTTLASGENRLPDGSIITVSGNNYTFKNVRRNHRITANFETVVRGTVTCHARSGDQIQCRYDGKHDYKVFDDCGNVVQSGIDVWIYEVPDWLRSQASPDCCQYNFGTNCNCAQAH